MSTLGRRAAATRPRAAALSVMSRATFLVGFSICFSSLTPAGCGGSAPDQLTHDQLMDPLTVKTCHPAQFADWSGSMHAYATDDPVFQAMNQRASARQQRLGTFCLKCHAPLAVRTGADTAPTSRRCRSL